VTINTSQNVGVGTTSPSARLHIVGGTAADLNNPAVFIQNNRFLTFQNAAGSTWALGIFADTSDNGTIASYSNLTFATGNTATERARIDTSGNFGIGTSSPARKLDVSDNTTDVVKFTTSAASDSTLLTMQSGSGVRMRFFPASGTGQYNWQVAAQTNISNGFEITPSTASGGSTFSTPAFVVLSSGNVGIGTSSPARRLHVFSSTAAEVCTLESTVLSSDNVQLRFKGFSGERWAIGNNVATGGTGVNFDFYDLVSSALRVRINSSGNLGLGTTSPGEKLEVAGNIFINTSGNPTMTVKTTGAGNNPGYLLTADTNSWGMYGIFSNTTDDLYFQYNGTVRLGLDYIGNMTQIGTNASAGINLTVRNNTDTGGDNTRYAGIQFQIGSDLGTAAIQAYRTNSASDYQTALTFLTKGAGAGATSPTERARITSTGVLDLATGAGAVGQIQFPATQVASSNVNTLDDYEEGDWTPRLTGSSGGNYTPTSPNGGRYIKIGRMVWATATLAWSAQVTGYSGNLALSGLPFTSTGNRACGSMGAVSSGLAFTAGYGEWVYLIDPGQTFVYIIQNSTSGSGYNHNPTVSSSGLVYALTVVYEANN
jgi:hypothetical protein